MMNREDEYRFPVGNGSGLFKRFRKLPLFLKGELLQETSGIINLKKRGVHARSSIVTDETGLAGNLRLTASVSGLADERGG